MSWFHAAVSGLESVLAVYLHAISDNFIVRHRRKANPECSDADVCLVDVYACACMQAHAYVGG